MRAGARAERSRFVRSPHAHAVIKKISLAKAKSISRRPPIFTGEDFAAAKLGGLPCGWLITDVNGQPMKEPPHPCLAQGKVRYVGDQVAIVVAETNDQARDAAELVEVDYEVLPAVVDGSKATAKGAPQLHEGAPDNTCYVWAIGDKRRLRRGVRQGGARHASSISSTTGWCRTRWSRAWRTARTRAPTTATRCTSRARTRTSSGC